MKHYKQMNIQHTRFVLPLVCIFLYPTLNLQAASCCGGGSASSLLLPKFSNDILALNIDIEHYDGFWDSNGKWVMDPQGSNLNQYRFNFGFAHRVDNNLQASVTLPYVFNRNQYVNHSRNTNGIGDGSVSIWYEFFDKVTCVWDVNSWEDLKPSIYLGSTLTVPTGTSPYDKVVDNFDITGRGVYRLDISALIDKTVYPWNFSYSASYGQYLERPVNREYGTYIEPYRKQLGNRLSSSVAIGYTYFTDKMESLTTTISYTYLKEGEAQINGAVDPISDFRKESVGISFAWASEDKGWISKLSWSHAPSRTNWGVSFPTTDVITIGVSHVLP